MEQLQKPTKSSDKSKKKVEIKPNICKKQIIRIQACEKCHQHKSIQHHDESVYFNLYSQIKNELVCNIDVANIKILKNQAQNYLQPILKSYQKQSYPNQYFNEISHRIQQYPRIGSFQLWFQGFIVYSKLNSIFQIVQQQKLKLQQRKYVSRQVLVRLICGVVQELKANMANLRFLKEVQERFRFFNIQWKPAYFQMSIVQYLLNITTIDQHNHVQIMLDRFRDIIDGIQRIKIQKCNQNSIKRNTNNKVNPYIYYNDKQKNSRIRLIYDQPNKFEKVKRPQRSQNTSKQKKNFKSQSKPLKKQSKQIIQKIEQLQYPQNKQNKQIKIQSCQYIQQIPSLKQLKQQKQQNQLNREKQAKQQNQENWSKKENQQKQQSLQILQKDQQQVILSTKSTNYLRHKKLNTTPINNYKSRSNFKLNFDERQPTQQVIDVKKKNLKLNHQVNDQIYPIVFQRIGKNNRKINCKNVFKGSSIMKVRISDSSIGNKSITNLYAKNSISLARNLRQRPLSSVTRVQKSIFKSKCPQPYLSQRAFRPITNILTFKQISKDESMNQKVQQQFSRQNKKSQKSQKSYRLKKLKISQKQNRLQKPQKSQDSRNYNQKLQNSKKQIQRSQHFEKYLQRSKNSKKNLLKQSNSKYDLSKQSNFNKNHQKQNNQINHNVSTCKLSNLRSEKDFITKNITQANQTKRFNQLGLQQSQWQINSKQAIQQLKITAIKNKQIIQQSLKYAKIRNSQTSLFIDQDTNSISKRSFAKQIPRQSILQSMLQNKAQDNQHKQQIDKDFTEIDKIATNNDQSSAFSGQDSISVNQLNTNNRRYSAFNIQIECDQQQYMLDDNHNPCLVQKVDFQCQCEPSLSQIQVPYQPIVLQTPQPYVQSPLPLQSILQYNNTLYQSLKKTIKYQQAYLIRRCRQQGMREQSLRFRNFMENQTQINAQELGRFQIHNQLVYQYVTMQSIRNVYKMDQVRLFPNGGDWRIQQPKQTYAHKQYSIVSQVIQFIGKIDKTIILRLFQNVKSVNYLGYYGIWLFNPIQNKFCLSIVNDQFLTNQFNKLIFSSITSQSCLWYMLLQKSLAKYFGSYNKLYQSSFGIILRILTGCQFVQVKAINEEVVRKVLSDRVFSNKRAVVMATSKLKHGQRVVRIIGVQFQQKGLNMGLVHFQQKDTNKIWSITVDDFINEYQTVTIVFFQPGYCYNHESIKTSQKTSQILQITVNSQRQFPCYINISPSGCANICPNLLTHLRLFCQIPVTHPQQQQIKQTYRYGGQIQKLGSFFFQIILKPGKNILFVDWKGKFINGQINIAFYGQMPLNVRIMQENQTAMIKYLNGKQFVNDKYNQSYNIKSNRSNNIKSNQSSNIKLNQSSKIKLIQSSNMHNSRVFADQSNLIELSSSKKDHKRLKKSQLKEDCNTSMIKSRIKKSNFQSIQNRKFLQDEFVQQIEQKLKKTKNNKFMF